ncbi:IPT/TIG domain-containing protein [Erythrobacter litoralis]|uniref:IPT/TIG domain-containing protein n=1 Tax=Erythrobacter litoralis (strain HTCC2594) TaxID=314225 RepID=Q2N8M8_ERYLH|nr:IPT/TIG domain-containing protein [Erythrobacter litoralis]ABC63963.1 hypothetical protein ELI_09355 [Erythrobacter litoralis HTCC2594]
MPTLTEESVVTMASIFEALEGVLSEDERQALLTDLIDVSPEGVAPGDLITAELFNAMMSDINSLKIRVAGLEGASGAPVITGISPSGAIPIFSLLTLRGVNFDREYRNNTVRIGNTVIRSFRRGDETSLAFTVPNEFADLPATLPLTIETDGQVSNAMTVSLVENVPEQDGAFDIITLEAPSGVMSAGETIEITWQISAPVILADVLQLQLAATATDGANEAEWQANTRFSPQSPLAIAPGSIVSVTATIDVPDDARAADLRLRATRQDGEVSENPTAVEWRDGGTLEVSDPRADITFDLTGNADGVEEATIEVNGASVPGLTFTNGGQAEIQFILQDNRTGTARADYDFAVTVESNAAAWPITLGPIPASETDIPAGDPVTFSIIMNNSGGSVGDITHLRVEATQTATAIESYTSFARIPLQRV